MEQLLAHLFGDYVLQSHKMATTKTNSTLWALYHAMVYTLPFIFLTTDVFDLFIISFTHFIIDRFKLALFVTKIKNYCLGDFNWSNKAYPDDTPVFLSTWLIIIVDNSLHLLINYIAIIF